MKQHVYIVACCCLCGAEHAYWQLHALLFACSCGVLGDADEARDAPAKRQRASSTPVAAAARSPAAREVAMHSATPAADGQASRQSVRGAPPAGADLGALLQLVQGMAAQQARAEQQLRQAVGPRLP